MDNNRCFHIVVGTAYFIVPMVTGYNFTKKYCISVMKIVFVYVNSVDPDWKAAFIWVFNVS